jgi:hypothetical protein
MFWFALLVWAVTTVAFEIIRPKPKFEDARPAALGDFQFPTVTEGRAVPLVWGQVKLKAPNVIWYGDFSKEAQTEEVSTGLFSSETVITHYRYFVGMHFALCLGPVDSLEGVWNNEKNVYSSTLATDTSFGINRPNHYGGEEHGSGGLVGTCDFYRGTLTSTVNSYLDGKISDPLPAYRGICHVVWRRGWIGNSNNVAPWFFEVKRIPDGLNLESVIGAGGSQPTAGDCNPMNVLYEILTDTDWGLSIDSSDIDTSNFQDAAETLHDEGNGFSMVVDNATQLTDIIDEIQRQIDGSLYFDRGQGQWRVRLARDDYTVGTLTTLDETNILELKEFTRQTWEETTNQVRVSYVDRDKDYNETYAFAQDPANMEIQGATVQSDVRYPGVRGATLANTLAWRDLKAMSYPLAKCKITVNRGMWNAAPGSLFKFSWNRLGIADLVMRVSKINYGAPGDSKITIDAIQDIFSTETAVYGDPTGTGWDEPTNAPAFATVGNTLIFEAPRQLIVLAGGSIYHPRIWMSARNPGDGTTSLRSYIESGTSSPPGGGYTANAPIYRLVRTGTLNSDLVAYGSTAARPDTSYTITINEVDTLDSALLDGTSDAVDGGRTLVYIDGEFIGYEEAEDLGGGQIRLQRIYRGLLNSAPAEHASTSTVWFISLGGALSNPSSWPSSHDELTVQLRGVNGVGEETTEAETPEIDVSLVDVYLAPLPPRDPILNSVYADKTAVSIDTSYTTETGRTGLDAYGVKAQVTARDWRVDQITADAAVSGEWTGDDPQFEFSLVLGPGVEDITVGPFTIDDDDDEPELVIERNEIILAAGANQTIPTDAKLVVEATHWVASARRYSNPMEHEMTITTGLTSNDDLVHGGIGSGTFAAVTYGETGTYNFDLVTALNGSGRVEARINSGSWATVISAGNTNGTLAVTASDSVELRWQGTLPDGLYYLAITGPSSETGYGVIDPST